MNARTVTLLIAILSTIATALMAVVDVLPPQWALLVGAIGAGTYGLVRTLQKVKAGTPLSALLKSTEVWGAALVALAAIVGAIAKVVPPAYAGIAATIAAIVIKLARAIQVGVLQAGPAESSGPPGGSSKS